jgi:hypothetical protein
LQPWLSCEKAEEDIVVILYQATTGDTGQWEDLLCAVVICKVYKSVRLLDLLLFTSFMSSVNPITSPNPALISNTWKYLLQLKERRYILLEQISESCSSSKWYLKIKFFITENALRLHCKYQSVHRKSRC